MSVEEAARFCEAAAASRVSLSRFIRQCLLDYQRMTEDLTKPNSFALAETEERLARHIDAQSRRVSALAAQLQVLSAMVDRLAFISLVHMPEVPAEKREAALASGARLYKNWRRVVAEVLDSETYRDTVDSQQKTSDEELIGEETGNGFGDHSVSQS
jgi:methyl-accepting chemotaxis protein